MAPFIVAALAVAVVLIVLTSLATMFRKVGPNQALIVYGFGGTRIVHGHTPIAFVTAGDPGQVTEPLVSPDGRVVNADHCLFGGGPGFVVRL